MIKSFWTITLLFFSVCVIAQSISGVVNIYTPVTQLGCNNVTVANPGGFSVGDRALLIQMKGATVDQSNTAVFGSVLNYNEAGNYEFATITSVTGNTIYFQYPIINNYSPSGIVQLIRAPQYAFPNVNSVLTCAPWNGTTGGVLVMEVSGTLTLNSNIDVSGKGFRGGTQCTNPDGFCGSGYPDYYYLVSSGFGAQKGEGICVVNPSMDGGRGAWANGGGGGNKHNSGGGGGGNYSTGGSGGKEANFCPATPVGGVGGNALSYTSGKIFLGGGGGCSDNNNGVGTVGTNGGGIVIIKANAINGNNDSIKANGINQTFIINNIGDGAGGGGAGGTILLATTNFPSALNVVANGGHGGDQKTSYGSCFGTGGGGGTGVIYLAGTSTPANLNCITLPGTAGIDLNPASPCYNTSYGAQSGQNANAVLHNLVLPNGSPQGHLNLGPDTSICYSSSMVLNTGISGATYTWSTGAATQTISVTQTGTYWATVDQGGCISADTIKVTSAPVILSASNNGPVCAGQTLNLSVNSITGATYSWSGPNSFSSSQQNPSVSNGNATSGVYSVTVTPASCPPQTATTSVSITPLPATPSASANSPLCVGATLSLTTNNYIGANFAWLGPNNFSSTGQNPSIPNVSIAAGGTYSLSVTVNGCTSPPGTVQVVVNPVPNTPIASNDGPVCTGQIVNVNAGNIGGATFGWSGPNGFNSSQQNNTLSGVTAAAAGIYSVSATVAGCTSSIATTTVVINPLPPAPQAGNNSPACNGATMTFTAANVSGASYSWTGPGSFSSASQNFTLTNLDSSENGNYSVTITVLGCTSAPTVISASVTPLPAAPVATSNSPVCVGSAIALMADTISGGSYIWSGPNGFSSSQQNPSFSPAILPAGGTYSVVVTVSNCTGPPGTVSVTVVSTPVLSILPADTVLCSAPFSYSIVPTVTLSTYNWSTGDSTPTISVNTSGTYWLNSVLTGCNINDSIKINFTDLSSLTLGPDVATCDSVLALSSNINGVKYLWSTGATTQQIEVNQNGLYYVSIHEYQCHNSDTVRVDFLSNTHMQVPNIVTPNGDGINDNLTLLNRGAGKPQTFSFVIFNRWGVKVFQTSNVDFSRADNKHLSDATDGTYFWVMEYTDNCLQGVQTQKGFLTIVR